MAYHKYAAKNEEGRTKQKANLEKGPLAKLKAPAKGKSVKKRRDPLRLRYQFSDHYASNPRDFRMDVRVMDDGRNYRDVYDQWQEDLQRALDDSTKQFRYIQLSRGHDKTSSSGLRALHDVLCAPPGSEIPFYAADKEQARIAINAMKRMIRRNRMLDDLLVGGKHFVRNVKTGSEITVEPSDACTAYGKIPYRVYCDELHAWRGDNARELWEVIISSTGKVSGCTVTVHTNAGSDFNSLCRSVYELAKTDDDWFFYETDGPVASWITAKWIEQQRRMLNPAAFDRLIMNQWISSSDQFANPHAVDMCKRLRTAPAWDGESSVAIGVDLGLKHDLAVVAVVTLLDDGATYQILEMECWQGTTNNPVRIETVEAHIELLQRKYPSAVILADPWQMASSIQKYGIKEFQFSEGRIVQLTGVLWRIVNEARLQFWPDCGRVVVNDNACTLATELKSLVMRHRSYGDRFDHPPGGSSDRAVAAGMAAWWLASQEMQTDPIFIALPFDDEEADIDIACDDQWAIAAV